MTSLFNSGTSGLLAARSALATAGHNITNVNTEGFSRQRVELTARASNQSGVGFVGAGVSVGSVQRVFDGFVSSQIRTNTSAQMQLTAFHDLAAQVDNLLANEDAGLSFALQGLFGAMHDLAADPTSVPARQVVLGKAAGLIQRFHSIDQRLDSLRLATEQGLRDLVSEINSFSQEIAELNIAIVLAEGASGGRQPANDLRDQREELLRELSERVRVTSINQDDGSLNVFIGTGQSLVVGSQATTLSVTTNQFDPTRGEIAASVGSASSIVSSFIDGRELAAMLNFRAQVLDVAQNAAGRVATGLAESFNTQHRLGMDLNQTLGGDFFVNPDTLTPRFFAHTDNTGSPPAALSLRVDDVLALTDSDYELARSGATYTMTRLSDNTSTTLTGFPAGTQVVDGIAVTLSSGAIADGDRFLLQPTRTGAADIALKITHTNELAVAAPVRGSATLSNAGTGVFT